MKNLPRIDRGTDFAHYRVERRAHEYVVLDRDHVGTVVARCQVKGDACLIASLLSGHRQACREVATIHRPKLGGTS